MKRTNYPKATFDTAPKPSIWPKLAAFGGGAIALGCLGAITFAMLRPDPNTTALVELLREEQRKNAELSQQVQVAASSRELTPINELTQAEKAAMLEQFVTRSGQSPLLDVTSVADATETQQSSAVLQAALERQNNGASAIEQLAGTDPCIAELTELVSVARIPFGISARAPAPEDLEAARHIADVAQDCPQVMVAVEGHTDPSGNEIENLLISWERAESTISLLAAEGYDVSRFEPLGFGSRHMAVAANTIEAAAANRRVQFHLAPMPE